MARSAQTHKYKFHLNCLEHSICISLLLRCIIWSTITSFWRLFLIFWRFSFDFQCNLGQAGELSIWEFSGVESYHMVYDHFIGNTNCIHTVVFNVEDKPEVQLAQVRYWLHFLQSRVPPVEPLGEYTPFISRFFFRQFSARFCFAKFHVKSVVFNVEDKPEAQLAQVWY